MPLGQRLVPAEPATTHSKFSIPGATSENVRRALVRSRSASWCSSATCITPGPSLRMSALIELVGTDTRKLLDDLYGSWCAVARAAAGDLASCSGVITQIDHDALVPLAAAADCVLTLVPVRDGEGEVRPIVHAMSWGRLCPPCVRRNPAGGRPALRRSRAGSARLSKSCRLLRRTSANDRCKSSSISWSPARSTQSPRRATARAARSVGAESAEVSAPAQPRCAGRIRQQRVPGHRGNVQRDARL